MRVHYVWTDSAWCSDKNQHEYPPENNSVFHFCVSIIQILLRLKKKKKKNRRAEDASQHASQILSQFHLAVWVFMMMMTDTEAENKVSSWFLKADVRRQLSCSRGRAQFSDLSATSGSWEVYITRGSKLSQIKTRGLELWQKQWKTHLSVIKEKTTFKY